MKKIFLIITIAACCFFTSCKSMYNFCQIVETQPMDNNGIKINENGLLTYENDQCIITYNFWSSHGSASFEFHNKTNEIIYLDLTKSFFCRNGMAYNLYRGREWSESSTKSTSYYDSYSYQNSASASTTAVILGIMTPIYGADAVSASKSTSSTQTASSGESNSIYRSRTITTKEEAIIAIPPHKSKHITTYQINGTRFVSCELQKYPEQMSRVTFTKDSTPLQFSNYITYSIGDNKNCFSVENSFYVSAITNYAEPEIVEFRMRQEPCENLKDNPNYASKTAMGEQLYDKLTKNNVCTFSTSFYNMYSIETADRLYKNKINTFLYSTTYHAYLMRTQGYRPKKW